MSLHLMAMVLAAPALAAPALAGPDPGERAFQRCYACHAVDPAETGAPGPNLAGVIGRRAGSLPDYEFSPALTAAGRAGLVWTRERIARFVADPQALVPGTQMQKPGLPEAERDALLDYLARTAP